MVVTKVAFDMEAESPKLTFKPVGFLDDAAFAEVQEVIQSDVVTNILGASPAPLAIEAPADPEVEEALKGAPPKVAKTKVVTEAEVEQAVAAAEPEAPKAKPKATPKPPVVDSDVELDLDGINFDD